MDRRTDFSKNVIRLIRSIPKGRVATYGLIARLAGIPNGARGVGWLLHSSTRAYQLPWHRVIKADGKLPFPELSSGHARQKRFLQKEGVEVIESRVDLKKYLWSKSPQKKRK